MVLAFYFNVMKRLIQIVSALERVLVTRITSCRDATTAPRLDL